MESLALFDADLVPTEQARGGASTLPNQDTRPVGPTPAPPPFATAPAPEPKVTGPTLLAVDGNSLAHRAYHAYAAPHDDGVPVDRDGRAPDGRDLVGAGLYGFLALLAAVHDLARPAATVIGFDCRQRSFRRERWPVYKAQRADKPPALDALLDELPRVVEALGGYVVTAEGCEADDLCGSAAAAAEARRWRCVVATSDRDAYALISDTTSVLRLRSGMHNAVEVTTRRLRGDVGVEPAQYVHYAALRGDASDNLPGIPGIGRRRARDLLSVYPSVDDAVADPLGCRSVLGPQLGQALLDDVTSPDSVFRRNVAAMTVRRDLPVDLDAGRPSTPPEAIDRYLRGRQLAGLIARMALVFGHVPPQAPPPGDEHAPPP